MSAQFNFRKLWQMKFFLSFIFFLWKCYFYIAFWQ